MKKPAVAKTTFYFKKIMHFQMVAPQSVVLADVVQPVPETDESAKELKNELIIPDDDVVDEEVVVNASEAKLEELVSVNNNEPELLIEKSLSPNRKVALYIQQSEKIPGNLRLSVRETDSIERDDEPQSDSVLIVRKRPILPQSRNEAGGSASKIARPRSRINESVPTAAEYHKVSIISLIISFQNFINYTNLSLQLF